MLCKERLRVFLIVLLAFLTFAMTSCGPDPEEFDGCLVGTWENYIHLSETRPFGRAVMDFWNIRYSDFDDVKFRSRSSDKIVLNADGSYLIQDSQHTDYLNNGSSRLMLNSGYTIPVGVVAEFHFEERGTYEIHDPDRKVEGDTVVKFFPERVDVQIEEGAYFYRLDEHREKVYLDVEGFNKWLNDVGIYSDTMIHPRFLSSGDSWVKAWAKDWEAGGWDSDCPPY